MDTIKINLYTNIISILCILGTTLSGYSYYIETKNDFDNTYEAMCDINEHVSCTRVFTSKYTRGFGLIGPIFGELSPLNISNGLYGVVFYTILAVVGMFKKSFLAARMQASMAIMLDAMTVYLAFILFKVLEVFCIICVSIYAINLVLSYFVYRRYQIIKEKDVSKDQ